jgi:hypothetical protein
LVTSAVQPASAIGRIAARHGKARRFIPGLVASSPALRKEPDARRGFDYLICRYAPAGNVVGERAP